MKKILSVLICVLLLLSTVSIAAYAVDNENSNELVYVGNVSPLTYDPTNAVYIPEKKADNSIKAYRFNTDDANTPYTFYSQLNSYQKMLYNYILENPFADEYTVSFGTIISEEEWWAVFYGSLTALADDHPELFWLIMNYDLYTFQDGYSGICVIPNFKGNENFLSPYDDLADCQAKYNEMMSVINNYQVKGGTRYEKLKNIHDYIANLVIYDPNLNLTNENPTDHEPTSVFLEPHTTVCEGYSEAFQLLCQKAAIPCVTVCGYADASKPDSSGHAWNYVKMEDNKWYAVDVTWDDGTNIAYQFFIVGSATPGYYNNTTFVSEHIWTGTRYISDAFISTYPPLNASAYSAIMLNFDSKSTVNKTTSSGEKYAYILNGTTVSNSFRAPYGYKMTSVVNQTAASFSVQTSGGSTVETYTVIMRGDVVINGKADLSDYNKVRGIATFTDYLDPDTAQFAAADMNSDGVVDAFDMYCLDRTINNLTPPC